MSQEDGVLADDQSSRQADLQAVLSAWHGATLRLEQTHEALRGEVRRLTDELEAKNRDLARKNRLADLGQMASHVAHEVRNSLVPVTLYMGLLRRRLAQDRPSLEILDKIGCGVTAVDSTVNDLLHFTADRDPQLCATPVRMLVQNVLDSLQPQLTAQAISTVVDVPTHELADVDPDMLRRAVLNLVLNSLDVMPAGGELVVTSYRDRQRLELEIADSGCGLSDDVRHRAFEPFFTTKRSGTGLGLAIVSRIAEVHAGDVIASNCPDGGAAFTIRIPQRAMGVAA